MAFPLKKMRVTANNGMPGISLSQNELAARLGIAQNQISRYESAPQTVPIGLAIAWCKACGFSIEDAVDMESETESENCGVDPGQPYEGLERRLALLREYLEVKIPEVNPGLLPLAPITITPEDLSFKVDQWKRKPTMLFAGPFDSGKTRLANTLLGIDKLPSEYTPTTSLITFVRHEEDRPKDWQREVVWILKGEIEVSSDPRKLAQFDPKRWNDAKYCEAFRIVAGGYETLKEFGTKENQAKAPDAKIALVYMAAPILRACTIIDVPGFQNDEVDANLALSVASQADILLYTSPAKGFLTETDFTYLGQLLRYLRPLNVIPSAPQDCNGIGKASYEIAKDSSPDMADPQVLRYSNFFLIATHAHPAILQEDVDKILRRGCERMFLQFGDTLFVDGSHHLSKHQLSQRIMPFWAENADYRNAIETNVLRLVADILPPLIQQLVDSEILALKAASRSDLRTLIDGYQKTMSEIEAAKKNIIELRRRYPELKEEISQQMTSFEIEIVRLRKTTAEFVSEKLSLYFSVEYLGKFIRKHFKENKEDAKKYAMPKLLEQLQFELEQHLNAQSKKVKPHVDKFLGRYEAALQQVNDPKLRGANAIPFDAQAAFSSGLAAASALGGLGYWASQLGTLGGYVLVSKLATVLSIVGLGVGSTGVITFVSAIGGPITLGISLATLLAIGIWSLLATDWEVRLAKKMAKVIVENNLLEKLQAQAEQFWGATEKAFKLGAEATDAKFFNYIENNLKLLEGDNSRQNLERAIAALEDLRDFFGAIPWKSRMIEHLPAPPTILR